MKEEVLRAIIKYHILRDFRIRDFEQESEIVKKRIGERAKEMGVPRELLLGIMKELMAEVLEEARRRVEKISFTS